jgi:hypothetical protein
MELGLKCAYRVELFAQSFGAGLCARGSGCVTGGVLYLFALYNSWQCFRGFWPL